MISLNSGHMADRPILIGAEGNSVETERSIHDVIIYCKYEYRSLLVPEYSQRLAFIYFFNANELS